jgi:succinyl-diaminopimelate desuccinylase
MKLAEAINFIDETELVGILKELVEVPGHVNCPSQEREISNLALEILKNENIVAEFQEVEPGRSNVIGKITGYRKGKSLALNGHLDTVPPNDRMADYKVTVNNGKLYGLGASDMKGAVAAMLYALIIVKRMDTKLDGDLYFTGVIGEESGGTGTRYLVNKGFRPDYTIVGEPTGLKIVNSHKGCFLLDVIIEGKAAHASMPGRGANAIAAMGDFISKINKEYIPELNSRVQEGVGSPTISFGIIHGGKKVNIVADKCILQIDRRWIVSEKKEMIIPEVEKFLTAICNSNKDLKFKVIPKLPQDGYFGPFFIPENHELIKICRDAAAITGREALIDSFSGWTDGATFSHAGIPTVILGPGDMEQAHTADEWVSISEVVDAVKIYLALISRICINDN